MDAGQLIDLDIADVAHGGVFVGRHEGRVVFVPDTLPGERVRVRLTDTSKASFWRGEVLEVLDASSHRRPHIWRQADLDVPPQDRPGGADFGHIDIPHQRRLKAHVIEDSLKRFAGFEASVLVHPAGVGEDEHTWEHPQATRWRTRVSLHVDADGAVGPFAQRSHHVVRFDDLPLATAEIERVARAVADRGGAQPGRIDLVQPADGEVRVIPRPEATRGTPPAARETIVETVGRHRFRLDAGGFWQVHRLAADTLFDTVSAALGELGVDPEAQHFDLYGGVGLFATALAEHGGGRVLSVESDARATGHAAQNLSAWPDAEVARVRVDRWLPRFAADADAAARERIGRGVVVLDPPRSGAGREVVQALAGLAPAGIVYVACDPVALARDLRTFRDAGYETSHLSAFDLFPHSHHVETIATLRRPGAAR
ncbi:23S rRNA methyltransferase [Microbacterium mangrovi]|uniref:23S rRNA methyltransferase n=1 Tax=Microbacterium mangrovi TaxID=1348253 RepID=A0A0B2AD22_9MICO|nr:TRAM domain-containing protein [Microbacterium mangrovi]KHK99482.1 23S rRNA methyltransferase [Microbacterium mangrovi]